MQTKLSKEEAYFWDNVNVEYLQFNMINYLVFTITNTYPSPHIVQNHLMNIIVPYINKSKNKMLIKKLSNKIQI